MKKFFRSLVLASVAGLGLLGMVATPTVAEAHPTHRHQPHSRVYYVYYRSCPQSSWVCYGGYYRTDQAQTTVSYFQSRGYDSYYR